MKSYPSLTGAALGFTIETITQRISLDLSGVLDNIRLSDHSGALGRGVAFPELAQ